MREGYQTKDETRVGSRGESTGFQSGYVGAGGIAHYGTALLPEGGIPVA
jgi:hypothetical protein